MDSIKIDWYSEESHLLINPRWPAKESACFNWLYEQPIIPKGTICLATSGTTQKKSSDLTLVCLTKKALISSAVAVNQHLAVTHKDIWLNVLPVFHVGGLAIGVRAYVSNSHVISLDNWNPYNFKDQIIQHGVTISALVPTQVYDLVKNNLTSPHSLRAVVVGGGFLARDLYTRARCLGWPLLPSYGLTELGSQVATANLSSLFNNEYPLLEILSHIQVRTDKNNILWFKSNALFCAKICGCPESSKLTIEEIPADGWWRSQDYGQISNNNLIFLGRESDFVKIGGELTNLTRLRNIFAEAMIKINGISAIGSWEIVPVGNERLGCELHLCALATLCNVAEIVRLYNTQVLPYERIRKIHLLDSIPLTSTQKIKLPELMELISGSSSELVF